MILRFLRPKLLFVAIALFAFDVMPQDSRSSSHLDGVMLLNRIRPTQSKLFIDRIPTLFTNRY